MIACTFTFWCLHTAARIVSTSMMTQFMTIRQVAMVVVAQKSVPDKHGRNAVGDWCRSPIGGRMQLKTTPSVARHIGESTQAEGSYSQVVSLVVLIQLPLVCRFYRRPDLDQFSQSCLHELAEARSTFVLPPPR